MGKRRTARERALQILYEIEFNDADLDDVLRAHWAGNPAPEEVREYAEGLVRGVAAQRNELDTILRGAAENWRVSRMTAIDRNILRLAVFELGKGKGGLAPAIVINEAIEIARRYSGEEAAVFVNGVLDAVRKTLAKAKPDEKVNDHEQRTQESPPARDPAPRRGGEKRPGARPRGKS